MAICKHCSGTGEAPDWAVLGQRIRDARVRKGVSLRALARRVGVSAPYLSDMERGNRSLRGKLAKSVLAYLEIGEEDVDS